MLKLVFRNILMCLLSAIANQNIAQVNIPNLGDNRTEIATWNLDWLGNNGVGFGPANDSLQQDNIKSVLISTNIDIWAFCEIYNKIVFDSLMKYTPQYNYVIATFSASQKTALAWNKNLYNSISSRHILTNYDYNFAGRSPFEVVLKNKSTGDTLTFIIIHGKANTGNTTEKLTSYNRRKDGSFYLKKHLDSFPNKKAILLGDYNDDVDTSIFDNLETPYINFVQDTIKYRIITKPLSLSNQKSTVSYSSMIDHQMISKSLIPYYIQNSAKVFLLSDYITNYANTTTDHYPVYSIFDFSRPNSRINKEHIFQTQLFPNPSNKGFTISNASNISSVKIYSATGSEVLILKTNSGNNYISIPSLSQGIYHIELTFKDNKKQIVKWVSEQ